MNKELKQIEQLKEGNCKVITKHIHGEKIFDGYYKEKFSCVYFVIPYNYEIVGYIQ